jgi:DNA topoisomerase-3
MSKQLIIAEKPSVAAGHCQGAGRFHRTGDYFESDDYVLSSAVGHLLEIAVPEEYEVKRGKWSFAHLPVIPPHFDVQPIEKNQERLKLLTRLIKRKDVDGLINACDAGREGELIFRLIVAQHALAEAAGAPAVAAVDDTGGHPRRLSSNCAMTSRCMPLADAARCRSEADWLVGINGTRAMTAFNSRDGGFYKTTGRPGADTDAGHRGRPRRPHPSPSSRATTFEKSRASFQASAGVYEGRWFDEQFKKGEDAEARAERLWDTAVRRRHRAACLGPAGIVNEESQAVDPGLRRMLFDLTSLQREANGRFGFSAKTTLSLAQALYEKHKVLTYPRTDSSPLPEDYIGTVKETLTAQWPAHPTPGLPARS